MSSNFTRLLGIWHPGHNSFLGHNGKVILFHNPQEVRAFKKKYPDLYYGMRLPHDALYCRKVDETTL